MAWPDVTPSCADVFFSLLVKSLVVYVYIYEPAVPPPPCANPVMRVHRLRGWCPCSVSGSAAWRLHGRMVPCWLMCWAPSGPPGRSLVRTENICLWSSEQTCRKTSEREHTRAPTGLWRGYVICCYILPLHQLPVLVDDLSQAVVGL